MHLPLVQHMHCIQKTNGSLSLGWGSVIAKGVGSGISQQRLKMKPNEPEDNQGVVTGVQPCTMNCNCSDNYQGLITGLIGHNRVIVTTKPLLE